MFSIKSSIAFATLFLALQSSVLAAEKCYEEVPVPSSMKCDPNSSNSADFAIGCKFTDATTVKKEIACPATWVNTDGKSGSQAEVCAAAGMKSTTIDGSRCAAGERRPSSGANHQNINYRYGKWGGTLTGGSIVQFYSVNFSSGGRDNRATQSFSAYYCWNPGNKRDMDSTDIVVAYACKR